VYINHGSTIACTVLHFWRYSKLYGSTIACTDDGSARTSIGFRRAAIFFFFFFFFLPFLS